jgi:hypothetical protein
VIDATGDFIDPYRWSGIFTGPDAEQRARKVEAIRRLGKPVSLTWGSSLRTVLVTRFSWSYERGGVWCPYQIECEDVPSGVRATFLDKPSLLGQIAGDITDALGITDIVDDVGDVLGQAQSALASVQQVLPIAGVLTGGSRAFLAVSGAIGTASGVLATASGVANAAVGAISAGGQILGAAVGAVNSVAALGNAVASTAQLAGAATMTGYVGRCSANLNAAGGTAP